MLKTIWFSLLAFTLGAWGANTFFRREVRTDGLPSASEQTNGIAPNAAYAHIDAYLERQLAALNVPGAALAIVEGAEIVHLRAFGQAGPDGQAITPQTPFFIGSLTKSVTAVAILQLVAAGKVEPDAPVQRYLPWFRVADPQATVQMTVRHLLNQTSGFTQTAGMIPLADFDDQPGTIERQVPALATFHPARLPGAAWEYSNVNYNLLGLTVAAASGETYETYVQNHIFAPLEMRHSHTAKAAAQRDGLAVGHHAWFGWPIAAPDLPVPVGSLPSGQLIASVEDMGHYLIAQLHNGRYQDTQLLSPASMGVEMGAYGMGWFCFAATLPWFGSLFASAFKVVFLSGYLWRTKMNPKFWHYSLLVLLVLLGLGGIGGGATMLADPSGAGMGLSLEMLANLPISNFVLPGLFLIGAMGLTPLVIAYGYWQRLPWAWATAVIQGVVLVLWIGLQFVLWGAPVGIQILSLVWGLAIVALCFAPGVRFLA